MSGVRERALTAVRGGSQQGRVRAALTALIKVNVVRALSGILVEHGSGTALSVCLSVCLSV